MTPRTYDDLSRALIDAIPRREEITALTDADIENLRRLGNTLDNVLYLELRRREGGADQQTAS